MCWLYITLSGDMGHRSSLCYYEQNINDTIFITLTIYILMSIQSDLEQAISRLPELEWKLTGLGVIKSHLLPRGLFKDQIEPSPQSCINEIKSDLQRLQSHPEGQEGSYLVNKIYRKVNVLVRICHEHERKNVKAPAAAFLVCQLPTKESGSCLPLRPLCLCPSLYLSAAGRRGD